MNATELQAAAAAIRSLSMDAIQAANSGHPGLPMGIAELGALLYGEIMQHDPADPGWENRDRFILSAGHGSMLVYSLLHLAGYDLPLEELKNFRQVGSKTPGHPEWGHTVGVETTTGPLGQGMANAVGMAIAESMAAARFNTSEHQIIDHYTYAIVGDGCMMEGVTAEAASLAGHLQLGKLIVFYDDNQISIDGSTEITFTEDVPARFRAYGWHVQSGDAYDADGIRGMIQAAREITDKPSFISLRSIIGKGSPNKAGTAGVHGAALGEQEVAAAKRELGLPEDTQFYIPPVASEFFAQRRNELGIARQEWKKLFADWAAANPALKQEWEAFRSGKPLQDISFPLYSTGDSVATRSAGQKAMQAVAAAYPNLVGGSADLAASNKTKFDGAEEYSSLNHRGSIINYGVREHAMGAVCNGIALYGLFKSFAATFLVFSDYMRPSVRLAALMQIPSIFVYTHDSIFVGEDGPTHQPIEHYAAMRAIPNLHFYRPGDAEETNIAWQMALERPDGPVALSLTRQNLPVYAKQDPDWQENMRRGAYIVQDSKSAPEVIVVATGSEVALALEAADSVKGTAIRVVSMPSRELFLQQSVEYREAVLPPGVRVVVAEAGIAQGWEVLTGGRREDIFSIDRFGVSGPGAAVADALEFSAAHLAARISQKG
ncbi:transketolase [Spirochaeta africana]|uniref:Transketolase n=1 Tax=Spirochaeta africana (strain ATCC 700263 / DSM 8902 / Z-7692) TaxID=889378 RepID=H9UMN7_SPIAZ|nr:transketolase [Spirochaeta africana]AFG38780.1 transketolase [Spirochaeta africana DSM 8902]